MNECQMCGTPECGRNDLMWDWLEGVSNKVKIRLLQANIYTMEKLCSKTDQELLKHRGIGINTLRSIKNGIQKYNERVGVDH